MDKHTSSPGSVGDMSAHDAFAQARQAKDHTRQLDAQDVREGKPAPEALHFVPAAWARRGSAVFPGRYRRS